MDLLKSLYPFKYALGLFWSNLLALLLIIRKGINIDPTKKWSIKKSDGNPFVQSGKKSNVENKLYISIRILFVTMADWDQKYGYF